MAHEGEGQSSHVQLKCIKSLERSFSLLSKVAEFKLDADLFIMFYKAFIYMYSVRSKILECIDLNRKNYLQLPKQKCVWLRPARELKTSPLPLKELHFKPMLDACDL
jgi:hypothetical protein